jgi:hydroxymethylbilane synthase
VADALRGVEPGLEVEVVPIRTAGDERGAGGPPARPTVDDKSRFVKEIEDALLRGDADLAVHSAKDVPGELPDGLAIVGVPDRADPRDALCGAASLDELEAGAVVGTSSLRRRSQLLARRPDLRVEDLRGNVDTRLRRLDEGRYGAIVLAAAGLDRLGRDEGVPLALEVMTPAAGQGCLALEARAGDERVAALARELTHQPSLERLTAERALVGALDASCRTPVAAHAELRDGGLVLSAFVGMPEGDTWIRDRLEGPSEDPAALGRSMAERLLVAGAGDLLLAAKRV